MVGSGQNISGLSYVAIGRETTLGTYNTCTAALDFLSSSLKVTKEGKVLEQIERNRVHAKRISMSKSVSGDLEFYYVPKDDAGNYILHQGFGSTPTTATATGETVGGGAFSHTFGISNMDVSYTSLCINTRKGDATNGKVYEYNGVRVNELKFSAEIDDALKVSSSFIGFDASVTSNDVESALTVSASDCLNFTGGRVSVETSFASLTSTSFWEVQSVEFTLSNNLKADNQSRRIGTDILDVLPAGIANMTLNMSIRFDTTTAFDAMIAGTQLSAELEFTGDTMSGSAIREGLKLQFPKIYVNEAGDPEIGGPDELLKSDVSFQVLRDESSASGYAVQAVVTNSTSSYA
jgi:hypothetical protein